MAADRKKTLILFTIGALIIGGLIGWFGKVWKDSMMASKAGKDCLMADGTTKGITDKDGVCKV